MGSTTPVSEAEGFVPQEEIDASCRVPVLLAFGSAAKWLVIGLLLGVVAAIKMHAPAFLAHCPWLTYGRVRPAYFDAIVYGFLSQAGIGAALWTLARCGRGRLALILMIARSRDGSTSITVASWLAPSCSVARSVSTRATTWWFVRM